MRNLAQLLKKGGKAIIETGDIGAAERAAGEIASWWYVGLFEHHIFWSERSIRFAAEKFGFTVDECRTIRHKSEGGQFPGKLWNLFKAGLRDRPLSLWQNKFALVKRKRCQRLPDGRDHLRIVLGKN